MPDGVYRLKGDFRNIYPQTSKNMVRNYIRKRPMYNEEDMKNAIQAVGSGEMGYKKAATIFNVKRETLRDQVRKRYQKQGAGRNTALSADQERELEECLLLMSRWGFGLTRSETIHVVADFAASLDTNPFKSLPSEDWLRGFLKRHPQLTTRLPEQLKVSRAKSSANARVMREWFALVKSVLEDNGLVNRPDRVYNVDETGMPLDPKRLRVICQKNISHLFRVIGGSGRDSITVNGCARADGVMLPPYVVYSAKNLREAWMSNGPENCRYTCSDKGWMDSTVFLDWFEKLFLTSIPPQRPVLLIFDGHKSHISIPLIQCAVKNRVVLLKLPPNSTHTLQPLDVGVYGPLKTAWEKILIAFARKNLGTALTKEVFPSLLKQLWASESMSTDNIKSGFRRCGIMPFNPEAVPVSQYQAAEVFDKLAPSPDPELPTSSSPIDPHLSTGSDHIYSQPEPSTSSTLTNPQPSTSSSHANLQPEASTSSTPTNFQPSTSSSCANPQPEASTSSTPTNPEPSTSSSHANPQPQPSTNSAPSYPQSPTGRNPPNPVQSSPASPLPSVRPSIKDFFMKKISPMLEAKRQQSGKKLTVQRMYGESLTSMEFIQKLTDEEAAKQKKKVGKGGRPNASTSKGKRPLRQAAKQKETNDDSSDDSVDIDSDEEWMPPRKQRNDSDSDDNDGDFRPVGLLQIDRNVFDTFN